MFSTHKKYKYWYLQKLDEAIIIIVNADSLKSAVRCAI